MRDAEPPARKGLPNPKPKTNSCVVGNLESVVPGNWHYRTPGRPPRLQYRTAAAPDGPIDHYRFVFSLDTRCKLKATGNLHAAPDMLFDNRKYSAEKAER